MPCLFFDMQAPSLKTVFHHTDLFINDQEGCDYCTNRLKDDVDTKNEHELGPSLIICELDTFQITVVCKINTHGNDVHIVTDDTVLVAAVMGVFFGFARFVSLDGSVSESCFDVNHITNDHE